MDALKAKGNAAFKDKKFAEAIKFYTEAINMDPNSEAAGALYSNRAACHQGLSHYKEAVEDADRCIKVRPDWLKGYYRKGLALESLNQIDEAQKALQLALKYDEKSEEVMAKLQTINAALRERNDKSAPGSCKTPEDAKRIGNSLFTEGKYERAALFYARAIDLQKEPTAEKANFYSNRAACYQQTHMYNEMIDDCNCALKIEPNHVKALIRRAIAYEGVEKWKLALDDYNKAKSLAPGLSNVSQGVLRCQRAIRG